MVKFLHTRILPFETIGFSLLFIGLAIELGGSFSSEVLQSKENAELESTNVQLSLRVEELRKANDDLEILLQPKWTRFDERAFTNSLIGKPSMTVEVVIPPDDNHAFKLGLEICHGLFIAAWDMQMRYIDESDELPEPILLIGQSTNGQMQYGVPSTKIWRSLPITIRSGADWGVITVVGNPAIGTNGPIRTLFSALISSVSV